MFFNDVNHSWVLQVIELSRHHNPWISFFKSLLDSFMRPWSVWKIDFPETIGRNRFLNANNCHGIRGMNSVWSGEKWDQFKCYLGLEIVFPPNISSYNIIFQFRIVDLVNFNFGFHYLFVKKFLSYSLVDFFVNLDPNLVIFYSVDWPLSSLSKFIKNPNFSPHFIV